MRSATAMAMETPCTWPPMFPDGTLALWRSVVVETKTPVGLPGVGFPIVKPVIVTVYDPGRVPLGPPTENLKFADEEAVLKPRVFVTESRGLQQLKNVPGTA